MRETQNYLENLINYANAPIIVWTPDLKITKFNHAFEHLTGRSTEEVLGKELSILFPEENCEQVLLEIKRTLSGNNWESVEIPILNKDGSIRVALWNSANIYAENGTTLTATIAQGVDITERKRAEEALRESQDRYQALVENAVLGVTVIDTNYKIIMANSMIAKLFNRPVSDFVGKNCFREYEKREAVCSHCPGTQAMASGKTTEVETQGVRDDGSRFYVRNRAIPLFRPDGVAKGFIELVEDITERKKAEEKLERAAKEWTSTFDSITDLISIQDKDFRYIRVNKSFADTFRMKPEEIVGKTCYELVHGTREPWPTCPHKRALDDGKAHREEFFEPKLGIHIEVSVSPLIDEKGEVVGTVHITKNITERKKAEETKRRLVAIIEATPDFVGFADAKDKHIIYVNKAGRKMCGIGNDEDVTKLKISDVHPEWTNKMFAEEILPAAVRDGTWTGECAFLDIRDRHEIPVSMVLSSHKASNGEVEVFSTISRDITERKKAEEYIKKQNEFVETVINSLQYPLYVIDKDYNIVLSNVAAKKRGIVDGGRCYQLTHRCQEPCSDEHICPLKEVIRTGKPTVTEHIHFDNHGNGRNFEVHGDPILDKDGQVIQMIEYSIDVTERKKAEEELRESEQRLNIVLNSILAGVAIIDAETHEIVYANPLAIELIGLPKEEIIGRVCHKFICPAEEGKCPISNLGQTVDQAERVLIRGDGKEVSILKTVTPAFWQGRSYFVESFVDITKRKKAERELSTKMKEIEEFNCLAVGRELKMIELKREINRLLAERGIEQIYEIVE